MITTAQGHWLVWVVCLTVLQCSCQRWSLFWEFHRTLKTICGPYLTVMTYSCLDTIYGTISANCFRCPRFQKFHNSHHSVRVIVILKHRWQFALLAMNSSISDVPSHVFFTNSIIAWRRLFCSVAVSRRFMTSWMTSGPREPGIKNFARGTNTS